MKLIKLIKLNNLQYNANRDPAFYRRPVHETFRLQVLLEGTGEARAAFTVDGETLCEDTITLPGTFECRFSYDTPGSRIGTLSIDGPQAQHRDQLRIDVLEHMQIG